MLAEMRSTHRLEKYRFSLFRMLFEHMELFDLWKKSDDHPADNLYEITLELLRAIKKLTPNFQVRPYKKIAGKFLISISDLNQASLFLKPLPQFYFYLYLLHRKLLSSLANNQAVRYSQAVDLHFIANEIINKVISLDKGIKASIYQKQINKLKENFAEDIE